MRLSGWARLAVAALFASLWPGVALGDYLGDYEYTVLRDGDPIGTYRVTVSPGEGGLEVQATSDLAITFGPLTLYRFEHRREEIWRDGQLERMVARTDKNGDLYEISITKGENGYTRVINGREETFDPSTKVLALWHQDLFSYNSFLSPMEDLTYEISVDYVGEQEIELMKGKITASHYRMTGDTERDLYYDADGNIMKVGLLDHRGALIEYVLNPSAEAFADIRQVSGRAPAEQLSNR